MRLLADENIPGAFVRWLREHGHDVTGMAEGAVGTRDPEVASWAETRDRVLVTLDKDFGDLVFRERLFGRSGVVL